MYFSTFMQVGYWLLLTWTSLVMPRKLSQWTVEQRYFSSYNDQARTVENDLQKESSPYTRRRNWGSLCHFIIKSVSLIHRASSLWLVVEIYDHPVTPLLQRTTQQLGYLVSQRLQIGDLTFLGHCSMWIWFSEKHPFPECTEMNMNIASKSG